MKVKLRKPIVVGDKTHEEIVLNLDALTGDDVNFCVREAERAKGYEPVTMLKTDVEFHIQIASRASGIPAEILRKLPALDYVEVQAKVQSFFLTGTD